MTKKLTHPLKAKKSSPKARLKKPVKVSLVATKTPIRHFRLVSHAHSGKMIHHQHTSHIALMLMLLFVGVILALSQQITAASSGTVTVGAVVNGPPPTIGATITSPTDGAVIADQTAITISGTCAPSSFVVVQSNGSLVGSTNCTVAGIFALTVSLTTGENVLTALNYDNANQPGPATAAVRVTLRHTQPPAGEEGTPVLPTTPELTLPKNPSLIPGLPDLGWFCGDESTGEQLPINASNTTPEVCEAPKNCESYNNAGQNFTAGGRLSVAVVCIPRIIEQNQFYTLGLIVRGGLPPYALNIDFGGRDKDTLLSIKEPGYTTVSFRYSNVGAFNIKLNLTDSQGQQGIVETGVQVNGEGQPLLATITKAISPENWFDSPVPLYTVAVITTLAFWGGDIFNRRLGGRGGPHTPHGRRRAA